MSQADLLNGHALAKRLSLKARTINRLRKTGRIPVVQLGLRTFRYDYDAVVSAWVNEARERVAKQSPPGFLKKKEV